MKIAYDPPPPIGTEFTDNGFTYKVIAARKHTNQRGEASAIITWQGLCAHDGEPFTFKTGARIYSFRRRCAAHNQGWVSAVPFGTPDPRARAASGRSEGEIVKAFIDRWGEAIEAMPACDERRAADIAFEAACDALEVQHPGIFDD